MNVTNRAEKVDEKNVVFYLLSTFPSWVMVLKLSKKDLSKKPKSVKVLSCMLLKLLITLFPKMIGFIGAWAAMRS